MPTTNQSLLDAYNALFSNTPYGAMLRRRVSMGLQQRQQAASGQMPRGTAGAAEQSPYESPGGPSGPSGPGRGPSPSPLGGPSTGVNTASGSVPGAGTPGARSVSGPTRTPMGSQTTYAPSWDWNSQTARNIQKYTTPAATILTGPIFGPALSYAGRAIGALIGDRPAMRFPGYGMPRAMSGGSSFSPSFGPSPTSMVADRSKFDMGFGDYGGGGFGGGGGGSFGGGGSEIGAADPDRGGWGGDAY